MSPHTTMRSTTVCDLKTPALVFGGLLLTATVLCGAMEVSEHPIVLEEVKVAVGEPAFHNGGDLFSAGCGRNTGTVTKAGFLSAATRHCPALSSSH